MLKEGSEQKEFIIDNKKCIVEAIENKIIPHIIGHEYHRFYEMIQSKQHSGAWFELKDVVEVIIKLPTAIGISYLFQQDMNTVLENDILARMIKKPPTLGDWESFTKKLKKNKNIKKDIPTIANLLEHVIEFTELYRVVEWRNDMIGHGALPFENSEEFVETMCKLSMLNKTDLSKKELNQKYQEVEEMEGNLCKLDGQKPVFMLR